MPVVRLEIDMMVRVRMGVIVVVPMIAPVVMPMIVSVLMRVPVVMPMIVCVLMQVPVGMRIIVPVRVVMRMRVAMVMAVRMPVPGLTARRMPRNAVGLDVRARTLPGGEAFALRSEFGQQPAEPGADAMGTTTGGDLVQRRGRGEIAQETLGAGRVEVVEHCQQVGLGQQHQICGAEHHRILGRFVIALGHG